jgi:murein DD-endopeptidase MepM/ murein hydrolase activator NlpD
VGLPLLLLLLPGVLAAQPFVLPTPNQAVLEAGGEERYFVGTVGKPWRSGTFGCVRTDGRQMHEGLDIRATRRDARGEPLDPIRATAAGTVAYVSRRPSLSNYGNYLVLRHVIEGVEIHSLYAHLSKIRADLAPGVAVRAGEEIATMGRTSNTRERISTERAHLHFELNLVLSDRFIPWYQKTFPGQRNDHGSWNGQNLSGLDPWRVFQAQQQAGARFSLVDFIRRQDELCRVFVRAPQLAWARRFPMLVKPNPAAQKEGIAGYELALNFNGLPFEVIPRAASEVKASAKSKYVLLSVQAEEQQECPCRRLVTRDKSGRWQLADAGLHLLGLLSH